MNENGVLWDGLILVRLSPAFEHSIQFLPVVYLVDIAA